MYTVLPVYLKPHEITSAVDALIAEKVDAVFTPTDNTVMTAELAIYEKFKI